MRAAQDACSTPRVNYLTPKILFAPLGFTLDAGFVKVMHNYKNQLKTTSANDP
jgi:hypothetical protein